MLELLGPAGYDLAGPLPDGMDADATDYADADSRPVTFALAVRPRRHQPQPKLEEASSRMGSICKRHCAANYFINSHHALQVGGIELDWTLGAFLRLRQQQLAEHVGAAAAGVYSGGATADGWSLPLIGTLLAVASAAFAVASRLCSGRQLKVKLKKGGYP
jgi:hypothetical protein